MTNHKPTPPPAHHAGDKPLPAPADPHEHGLEGEPTNEGDAKAPEDFLPPPPEVEQPGLKNRREPQHETHPPIAERQPATVDPSTGKVIPVTGQVQPVTAPPKP